MSPDFCRRLRGDITNSKSLWSRDDKKYNIFYLYSVKKYCQYPGFQIYTLSQISISVYGSGDDSWGKGRCINNSTEGISK